MKRVGSLLLLAVILLTMCVPQVVFADESASQSDQISITFDTYIRTNDFSVSTLTVNKQGNDLEFSIGYQSGRDREFHFVNLPSADKIFLTLSGMLANQSIYTFKVPADKFTGIDQLCMVFTADGGKTTDAIVFKTKQFETLIPPPAPMEEGLVSNPYGTLNQIVPEYENGEIVSRVLPYDDFYSLFTKLPLGHTKATGNGINIAVIGEKNSLPSFVYYVARNSKVFSYNTLSIDNLIQQGISIVAIRNLGNFNGEELKNFVQDCINHNISVVIEGDEASNDDQIALVNDLERLGAISVGQVQRQGVTYEYAQTGTSPINPRLNEISVNIFAPNVFYDTNSTYALYGVTGALALLKEIQPSTPMELKNYLLSHSRNVWQLFSVDGKNMVFEDVTIDNESSQYIPKPNSSIFYFKQLDFQYLLNVALKAPWNANMYNLAKAWQFGKGNIDVAIIDQSFFPDSPEIKNNVVEKKAFGKEWWNENFHGTSMSNALISIAPEAKLHLLLADVWSNEVSGKPDNIIKALDYCIKKKFPIISMSWAGFFGDFPELKAKIQEAKDAGITVVWFWYPSEEKGIIRPSFTYYNQNQIAAFDRFIEDDMYYPQEIQAGISYTAPQVAGLVALIKEKVPDMTPQDVEEMLRNNSVKLPNSAIIPDMYAIMSKLSTAVSIKFNENTQSKDLNIKSLFAWRSGNEIEFTLNYSSGMDRKMKVLDSSKDEKIISSTEITANSNSVKFKIAVAALSDLKKVTLQFTKSDWNEKDSITFHGKDIEKLLQ